MQVIYYKDKVGNFGDDLNAVIWPTLFGDALERDDGSLLVGIGTIFNNLYLPPNVTNGKRVFVLGSGVGYEKLPEQWPNSSWEILALRGPLSARVTKTTAAVTDGAALLASIPSLIPQKNPIPSRPSFIPHVASVPSSKWESACARANIEFINPQWPVSKVLGKIVNSPFVICEAMHGAIVADTLRVPWIPVVSSPRISSFKWFDWCWSMDLEYSPTRVPPSCLWEMLRHHKLRTSRQSLFNLPSADERIAKEDALLADYWHRYGRDSASPTLKSARDKGAKSIVRIATKLIDPIFVSRCANRLARIARDSPPILSEDRILKERSDALMNVVESLISRL